MKIKIIAAVLIASLLCGLCGCSTVAEIAGNVMAAASAELENQVKAALQEHKVEVIEVKTALGNLNSEDEKALQFFCAALITSESDSAANTCADALGKVFEESGAMVQTGSKVESQYLVHKEVVYDFTEFEDGKTYYTVYVYTSDISFQLPEFDLSQFGK